MEQRVRPLMVAATLVFALAGTGCVTIDPTAKTMKVSVAPEAPPPPATTIEFLWQRQLMPLSDAVNDGRKVHGLPGQMFLFTSSGASAEITGDIMVMVYDETRRPNGIPPHKPEGWHFTKDVLKRLVTTDERFGTTYALFLPWPDHWKDVTMVRIAARYDGADKTTKLTSKETRLLLDTRPQDGPLWTSGPGQPSTGAPIQQSMYDQYGEPDPAKAIQQMRGPATVPAYPQAGAQPAGYATPPTIAPPPPGPGYQTGAVQAPMQPLPPPQLPASGPAPPIPLPAKSW